MIYGYFGGSLLFPEPKPMVPILVFIPGVSSRAGVVRFLLDTGSSVTSLHALDAVLELGISVEKLLDSTQWPSTTEAVGIGGTATLYPVKAYLTFAFSKDPPEFYLIEETVHVAKPSLPSIFMPSILGWNVLRRFHIILDARSGLVELRPW